MDAKVTKKKSKKQKSKKKSSGQKYVLYSKLFRKARLVRDAIILVVVILACGLLVIVNQYNKPEEVAKE